MMTVITGRTAGRARCPAAPATRPTRRDLARLELADGLLAVRIEGGAAIGRERLDPGGLERAVQLQVHQPDAVDPAQVAQAWRQRGEGALEAIQRGQDAGERLSAGEA